MIFDKTIPFFKSAFSEPDGTASSSRIMIALLVSFIIGVGITFAIKVDKSHLLISDFDNFLGSAGTFIITTCGPLYAINKGAAVMQNKDKTNGSS